MSVAAGQQLFCVSTGEASLATGPAEDSWQLGDAGYLAGVAKGTLTNDAPAKSFAAKWLKEWPDTLRLKILLLPFIWQPCASLLECQAGRMLDIEQKAGSSCLTAGLGRVYIVRSNG